MRGDDHGFVPAAAQGFQGLLKSVTLERVVVVILLLHAAASYSGRNFAHMWATTFVWISAIWMAWAGGHDFHYSRTDLRWNPTTETWQMELRVFSDDLESALRLRTADETPFRMGDALERADLDELAASWLAETCKMTANNQNVPLIYIGKEVDYDITYLFLESTQQRAPETLTLSWTLFFDLFEDQINEVALDALGMNLRALYSTEEPEQQLLP
jgi:hypothetical protein